MRGNVLLLALLCGICMKGNQAHSESVTYQDIVRSTAPLPAATIYVAKEILTLDPRTGPAPQPLRWSGTASWPRGTLAELKAAAGNQPYTVDDTFADKVIVPGFIAQHDHRLLRALTMMSEIIAIEDWGLP